MFKRNQKLGPLRLNTKTKAWVDFAPSLPPSREIRGDKKSKRWNNFSINQDLLHSWAPFKLFLLFLWPFLTPKISLYVPLFSFLVSYSILCHSRGMHECVYVYLRDYLAECVECTNKNIAHSCNTSHPG